MPLIWKTEYSVGVVEIDDQHKKFVGILGKLFGTLNHKGGEEMKETVRMIFDELTEYVNIHFSTEEKYFDQFKYEEAEQHKKEHRAFEEKIIQLKDQYLNNELSTTFDLVDYLEDWLLDHLATMDKKYTKCFNDHGLF